MTKIWISRTTNISAWRRQLTVLMKNISVEKKIAAIK